MNTDGLPTAQLDIDGSLDQELLLLMMKTLELNKNSAREDSRDIYLLFKKNKGTVCLNQRGLSNGTVTRLFNELFEEASTRLMV